MGKYVEKRKVKVKRDPNKPKRAPTSYNLYMKERRVKIAEKHPDMKSTEVIAQIGKEWREMSDEKKAPYIKRSKILVKEQERAMKIYLKGIGESGGDEGQTTKKRKRSMSEASVKSTSSVKS